MTGHPPKGATAWAASAQEAAPRRLLPSVVAAVPAPRPAARVGSPTIIVPLAVVALPALVAALLAGCGASPPTPSPGPASPQPSTRRPAAAPAGTRLAVLPRGTGDAMIAVIDDAHRVASIPPPASATAWISAGAGGSLLATTADGRLLLGEPPSAADGRMAWRELVPAYAGSPPGLPLSFGSISPDGRRLAALAADFSAGTAFDLVVADTVTAEATVLRVAARPDGAAPAWRADGGLLLVARDPASDATGIVLVDPDAAGPVARLELGAYGIALSADGRVAAIARADGRVVVGAGRELLGGLAETGGPAPVAGGGPPGAAINAPPGTAYGSLALDPGGTRLAVCWLAESGGPASIWRYRLTADGVLAESSIPAPGGAPTAVVAWLP